MYRHMLEKEPSKVLKYLQEMPTVQADDDDADEDVCNSSADLPI